MNFGNTRVESFIGKEEQRATEHNAGVVPGLQGCDQHGLAAHGVRVLLHLKT